ncbi:MAG: GAF domain-containing protein [Chloroflexi bacterium]|nr:GAF domain-containing protein [Chloroflexota bacterium]
MPRDTGLVQRLIAFLKKPEMLETERREPARNRYDDYEPHEHHDVKYQERHTSDSMSNADLMLDGRHPAPGQASSMDALVMRALKQFNAQIGFVIRYDTEGRMRYLTGRNLSGQYIAHTEVNPDRRAIFLTLDSGEAQLFVDTQSQMQGVILCGPLRAQDQVIGLLYLDNPSRSRLHRGVFDIFCEQASRMLNEGRI